MTAPVSGVWSKLECRCPDFLQWPSTLLIKHLPALCPERGMCSLSGKHSKGGRAGQQSHHWSRCCLAVTGTTVLSGVQATREDLANSHSTWSRCCCPVTGSPVTRQCSVVSRSCSKSCCREKGSSCWSPVPSRLSLEQRVPVGTGTIWKWLKGGVACW